MLDKLINASAEYLIRQGVISSDDRDIYEYGFHSLYSNTIIFLLLGIIALLLNKLPQTIVYHIAFISMRSIVGGYHAKSQLRCFFMSLTIWILSLWVIQFLHSPSILIALSTASTILVWWKAPIEHENNPLGELKFAQMKFISRLLSVILNVVICIICIMPESYRWLAASLTTGMISHSLLAITFLCKQHYLEHTKEK
ncbi:MAG: accessory gene regulator ArgB-like protein [Dysgonomonas sp.]